MRSSNAMFYLHFFLRSIH